LYTCQETEFRDFSDSVVRVCRRMEGCFYGIQVQSCAELIRSCQKILARDDPFTESMSIFPSLQELLHVLEHQVHATSSRCRPSKFCCFRVGVSFSRDSAEIPRLFTREHRIRTMASSTQGDAEDCDPATAACKLRRNSESDCAVCFATGGRFRIKRVNGQGALPKRRRSVFGIAVRARADSPSC
jgi:hypothetical protein